MKIIQTLWFPMAFGCIGIVVGVDDITKKRKAYIGVGVGNDKEEDSRYIAAHGSPVLEAQVSELAALLTEEKPT